MIWLRKVLYLKKVQIHIAKRQLTDWQSARGWHFGQNIERCVFYTIAVETNYHPQLHFFCSTVERKKHFKTKERACQLHLYPLQRNCSNVFLCA